MAPRTDATEGRRHRLRADRAGDAPALSARTGRAVRDRRTLRRVRHGARGMRARLRRAAHLRGLARSDRDGSRRGAGAHLRQPCADRHRRGRSGEACAGGEADVLLGGGRPGDDRGGRACQGDADGRLQQALRSGVSPAAGRGEGIARSAPGARHHAGIAVPAVCGALPPARAGRCRRHGSRPTMRRASPRRSATRIRCRAAPIIWCCSIPWCTSSTRSAACWASRIGWSSPTSANTGSPSSCASVRRNASSPGSICRAWRATRWSSRSMRWTGG